MKIPERQFQQSQGTTDDKFSETFFDIYIYICISKNIYVFSFLYALEISQQQAYYDHN